MKKGYTDIRVLLDKSGSMDSIKNDTIGGVNTFIKAQKGVEGFATFTLAQFGDKEPYLLTQDFVPMSEAKELTTKTFVPCGGTPLLDAIGTAITIAGNKYSSMNEEDRPEKVIFAIVTDGEENTSCEYTKDKIKELIEHQTNVYKWEFVFLAANQDAIKSGGAMGFGGANSMSYSADAAGVLSSYSSLVNNTINYRSGAVESMAFTEEQRTEAVTK